MRKCVVVVLVWGTAAVACIAGTGANASAGDLVQWRTVSAGYSHTCAIAEPGRLFCWGANYWGQLGDGQSATSGALGLPSDADQATPVEVAGHFNDWISVSAGETFTCGIRSSHRLYCWGGNTYGALGLGSSLTTPYPTPQEVTGQSEDWAQVSAGLSFACGLKISGHLFCWGHGTSGQLGNGQSDRDQSSPVPVSGGGTRWESISTGTAHACATKTNGRAFCWGANQRGQLGIGHLAAGAAVGLAAPHEVAGRSTAWHSISTGGEHTCGVRGAARLFCWGDMRQGGDGTAIPIQPAPSQVPVSTIWSSVGVGDRHSCAIGQGGHAFCWGSDAAGQVGDDPPNAAQLLPVQVANRPASYWLEVEGGRKHACGVRTSRELYCWGSDTFGQLGDDATHTQQPRPVLVSAS